MKKLMERVLPEDDKKRKWKAVGLTVIIAGLLTIWGIYGIRQYGFALFLLTPLFIGACSVILYGLNRPIKRTAAIRTGLLTLGVFTAFLLVFAIEGLICILMAAPIALVLTIIGSLLGHILIQKNASRAYTTLLLLVGAIPLTAFVEKNQEAGLNSVVTSIEIKADPMTVWKNVVEFPQLDEPTEFIFKTGIAYPINARINGAGVGAIRHCNFTTGSFVEPITVWNEPELLRFNVTAQPSPMKEVSLWDIDAPHLHNYFVSKQGQFRLIALANGNTRLEGTTWYYHRIRPEFYWQLWSEYIIHKIHERVLNHIKETAERQHPEKTNQ